jgi:NADPH-dependent glutamate synthase beta subunit-like oxidoreductase
MRLKNFVIPSHDEAERIAESIYKDIERRVKASPPDVDPVSMASTFLKNCIAQTCGKCVPCRVGLGKLDALIESVLEGDADAGTVDMIRDTADRIRMSADCAIGFEAADMVYRGTMAYREDYISKAAGKPLTHERIPVPCISRCPAHVMIPGYLALTGAGRYEDALRLIRRDNPFPAVCGLICEHPCEKRCRRNMIDDAINIRGIKRFAYDHAKDTPPPEKAAPTGRKIAVIGGGPSGLTAAYYLSLMGHAVTIYERRSKLGGMMRYGIPNYRLPRVLLDREIEHILSTGIDVVYNTSLGEDITIKKLSGEYDSVYISIGAHGSKRLGIEGESLEGVYSAVELLKGIGDDYYPDYEGKEVVVIGGGNVAMDVTRTARRLGAAKVTCVYRRRSQDMTALPEEVEGALAEGCELLTLYAPIEIKGDKDGRVKALKAQRQMAGALDKGGRPRPIGIDGEVIDIPADIIISAIGQDVEKDLLEPGKTVKEGITVSGGDCVSGPATVILAIAAGKEASTIIDRELGFSHTIDVDVEIPCAGVSDNIPCGRANMTEREAFERRGDFDAIENGLDPAEAVQEAGRCLRCDHYGAGAFLHEHLIRKGGAA